MNDSKLVKYIAELGQRDRERLRQLVHSPFFNQHKPTMDLLELILKSIAKGDGPLNREKVYQKLFPKSDFEEQKLHNVMSNLKKLFHRFLAIDYVEKQPLLEDLYTLEATFERNQFELMNNRAKLLEKHLSEQKFEDYFFHFAQYRLNNNLGYYGGHYVDRTKSETMQSMLDHFDRSYLIEKLRNCCHLTANSMQVNTHYDFGLLNPLLEYIQRTYIDVTAQKKDWTIRLYWSILQTMREESNDAHYQELKKMLNESFEYFSPIGQQDLYGFASNYCIRRTMMGDEEYKRELFDLYKRGLETGVLLNNGLITEFNYKNIATLGGNLREFDWTERFLQEYKALLPASKRENVYNYNLAYLFYNKKQYQQVLSSLLHVQFTDVMYYLNSNFLLLRTYYALKDTETLLSLIETFRIFVMRNKKMSPVQRKEYTNFLRFAKKLVELKHHSGTYTRTALEEKLKALRSKIESTDSVINRSWLLDEAVVPVSPFAR
ncbi:hypothetical protein [Haliscomenobacter sp.]|uniref:hypothetical protein n=1 Tax=Haliscomenobacter sp. TaxID=2717303 RepID=UPI003365113C